MNEFKIGNKAAEKWSETDALKAFETALNNTMKDESILCVQDAFFSIDMMPNYAAHLVKRFPVLEDYKRSINDRVISRINKGALLGDYNTTAGIWRMKQLGERDQQHQDITTGGQKISDVNLTDKQIDKIALSLIPKDE